MKRWKLALIFIFVMIFGALEHSSANSGAPPLANTGAPNEQNCSSCHNSSAVNSGKGLIRIAGVPREFQPGEKYDVTIQLQDEEASRWGFELTILNDRGQNGGKITLVDNTLTDLQTGSNGREYMLPTIAGNYTGQVSMVTWNFTWTAPKEGAVNFYVAGVAANRDSNPQGDRVYTFVFNSRLFQPRPPTLNFINPNSGSAEGGTAVIMGGENYRDGIKVAFGDIEVPARLLDETTLEAITPPQEPGVVDITLINPDGLSTTIPKAFTYNQRPGPPPQLLFASPERGPTSGNATVRLSGLNFQPGARVIWDGKELPATYIDTNFLSVKTPVHDPGVIPVTVINPDGQSVVLQNAYTYEGPVPPPIISILSPTNGVLSAGGETTKILWSIESNGTPRQRLLLSTDGGKTFPIVLATNLRASVNQFNWAIPEDFITDKARIRLEASQTDSVASDETTRDIKIVRAPRIQSLTPATTKAGKTRLDAEIRGINFDKNATAEMDGVKLKATVSSSSVIKIKKLPHMIPGTHFIRVRNPNGGVSSTFIFTVAE